MHKLMNLARAGGLVLLGGVVAHLNGLLVAQQLRPATVEEKPAIVAYVNGVPITRQELAEEMIARQGKKELELLINRKVIQQAALKAGITITEAEIDADIREVMELGKFRTAQDFEVQFLKKEKGCTLFEFREDIVRPGLVIKKMAGQQAKATEEELRQAFEAQFGEKVQISIILEQTHKVVLSQYAEIAGDVNKFREVARRQADLRLAAGAGRIAPVGRNTTYKLVEECAFKMKDGEVSEVLQVPEGFVIVLREHAVKPEAGKTFAGEREVLRIEVENRKTRGLIGKLFKEVRDKADIKDFLNHKSSKGLVEVMEKTQLQNAPSRVKQP